MTTSQAVYFFIFSFLLMYLAAYYHDKAQEQADNTIAEGMSRDYDKVSSNFKYQSYADQEEAIKAFRARWKGLVSKSRLEAQIVSLEEMRILCL